jgi:competence protein ComEA
MKAMFIAVFASLCLISFLVQATEKPVQTGISAPILEEKRIHLNSADALTLNHSVPGIGEKRAQAIVSYREQHGPFKSIQELAQVRGLGIKFVKNRMEQMQAVYVID